VYAKLRLAIASPHPTPVGFLFQRKGFEKKNSFCGILKNTQILVSP